MMYEERMHKARQQSSRFWIYGWYCEMKPCDCEEAEPIPCIGRMEFKNGTGSYEVYKVDPKTLCRCCGITDADGHMLYEYDRVERDADVNRTGIILYGSYEDNTNGFYIRWADPWLRKDLGYWAERVKVAGNRFEGEPD